MAGPSAKYPSCWLSDIYTAEQARTASKSMIALAGLEHWSCRQTTAALNLQHRAMDVKCEITFPQSIGWHTTLCIVLPTRCVSVLRKPTHKLHHMRAAPPLGRCEAISPKGLVQGCHTGSSVGTCQRGGQVKRLLVEDEEKPFGSHALCQPTVGMPAGWVWQAWGSQAFANRGRPQSTLFEGIQLLH
jgi:hypothetical protein